MKIEIIDDNAELTRHIDKSLTKKWHRVTVYNNRDDFVHNSDFSADLFLMDINLWDGNWLDLVEHIRVVEKVEVPIIIISGQTKVGTKNESLVIGADDFIEKPFTMQELDSRIHNIFSHIDARDSKNCWCESKPLFSCLSDDEKIKIFEK